MSDQQQLTESQRLRLDWLNLAREFYRADRQVVELRDVVGEAYVTLEAAESAVAAGNLPEGCPGIESVEQHLADLAADVDGAEANLAEQQMTLAYISEDVTRLEERQKRLDAKPEAIAIKAIEDLIARCEERGDFARDSGGKR